jgi:excisionase family DNA binding protein
MQKNTRRAAALIPIDAVLLTLDQACARTQLSRPTVVSLIHSGRLKGVKVGSTWRISASSIEYLVDGDWSAT